MKIDKKHVVSAAVVLALAAGAVLYSVLSTPDPKPPVKAQVQQQKKKKRSAKAVRSQPSRQLRERQASREKPNLFDDDAAEEAKLTAAERALLRELQDGVDANSLSKVAKAVEKIHAIQREKGVDAVPVYLRSEAVEALGWFLPDSLSNLIGFMADSDPDVLEDVMSHFESAIDDSSLSDRELSDIFKSVSKVLDNEDALDALFMGIESDMRNSVAVETYIEIIKNGSEAAKARVWESIEDFTGEDDIKTVEDLVRWSNDPENADDEDDDDFYGGDKDDKDDDDDEGDKGKDTKEETPSN